MLEIVELVKNRTFTKYLSIFVSKNKGKRPLELILFTGIKFITTGRYIIFVLLCGDFCLMCIPHLLHQASPAVNSQPVPCKKRNGNSLISLVLIIFLFNQSSSCIFSNNLESRLISNLIYNPSILQFFIKQ